MSKIFDAIGVKIEKFFSPETSGSNNKTETNVTYQIHAQNCFFVSKLGKDLETESRLELK